MPGTAETELTDKAALRSTTSVTAMPQKTSMRTRTGAEPKLGLTNSAGLGDGEFLLARKGRFAAAHGTVR